MKKEFVLTVFSENQIGLINNISLIFSRRKISMVSLNVSLCEINNLYRFTIVVKENFEIVQNLVLQIEKIIDVFRCYCNTEPEIIWKQMALCKLPTSITIKEENVYFILRQFSAKPIAIQKDYTVFEITGNELEINSFILQLEQYGLIEYVKSARIAIMRSGEGFRKDFF